MTYKEHQAQQAANSANSAKYDPNNRVAIHFAGEFLAKDGDVAVVRFPYHSMDDIVYTPTHSVAWPGAKFGKRVVCSEDDKCPLCAEGIKRDIRVFVKFITYTVDGTNHIVINNTIWDRPAAFADIDLKGLIDEYGDISGLLFKIRRSGSGQSTRYNIQPIINREVYPDNVYVANFEELNQVDPVIILTKSQKQYNEMLNPNAAAVNAPVAPQAPVTLIAPAAPQAPITLVAPADPQASVAPQPVDVPQAPVDNAPWVAPQAATPQYTAPQPSATTAEQPVRRQTRYQF